jgi:hypothetical protein
VHITDGVATAARQGEQRRPVAVLLDRDEPARAARRGRAVAASLDHPRHPGHCRRIIEEIGKPHRNAVATAQVHEELVDLQRVSAEQEEVVVAADVADCDVQCIGPQRGDLPLEHGPRHRRNVDRSCSVVQHVAANTLDLRLADLARCVDGKRRADGDTPRNLEAGQHPGRVRPQFALVDAHARREDDGSGDLLAQRGMRDREHARLRHCRMPEQHAFDFARSDLLAAAIDDILDPSAQRQIPVAIEPTQVAGAKPAVDERGRGGHRIVEVPVDDAGAARDDLAERAFGHCVARRVDDRNVVEHGGPDGARPANVRWQRVTRQRARLDMP